MAGRAVAGEVRRVDALGRADRDAMLALMETYFERVTPDGFARDLAEKEWAVLLRDEADGRLCGFSTVMRTAAVANGERVLGIFSGDTVVEREYWGESALARTWSRHAFRIAASVRDARAYWFLICSGYKTYRFLPVFYREFYPSYERPTPARERAILAALATEKFGRAFDAERGVVRFERPTPLAAGVADVTERRLRDPHVAYFAEANPGHVDGDELVCVTELVPSNLTPAGRRMVGPEIAR